MNVQRPTSNIQHPMEKDEETQIDAKYSALVFLFNIKIEERSEIIIRRWTLDVRCWTLIS